MDPDQVAAISRNPIPMEDVQSSQIAALGHDPDTQTLAVRFTPRAGAVVGSLYHYGNVDRDLFTNLKGAASIGSFFHTTIKPNRDAYPFVKLEDEQVTDQQAA